MIGRARSAIQRAGLIAVLNGPFPLQEILEIGDALMASPLPVMALSWTMADANDAVAALRARNGEQMLLGAVGVETTGEATAAIDRGAQFLILDDDDEQLIQTGHALGVLVVPTVTTAAAAQSTAALGCRMAHYYPADEAGPAGLAALCRAAPSLSWVAGGGIDTHNINAYVDAGAVALSIGNRPLPAVAWTMRSLILNVRSLRKALDAAAGSVE